MTGAVSRAVLTPTWGVPAPRFRWLLRIGNLFAPTFLATNKAEAPPSKSASHAEPDATAASAPPPVDPVEPPAPVEPSESDDEKALVRRLVGRAKKGDRDAYKQLVERYQKRVFGILFGMLRSREDAMELTQDVFIKVYQRIKDFEEKSSFYTWVYRIAFNLAIDFRRREWKKIHTEYDDAVENQGVDDAVLNRELANPEQSLQSRELGAQIQRALETLPDEQKQVLLLREVEGLSYQEMADSMGCSIGTIMSRLFYARKKMQTQLKTIYTGSGKWAPAKDEAEPPEADSEAKEGQKK